MRTFDSYSVVCVDSFLDFPSHVQGVGRGKAVGGPHILPVARSLDAFCYLQLVRFSIHIDALSYLNTPVTYARAAVCAFLGALS